MRPFYPAVELKEAERAALASWVQTHHADPFFSDAKMGGRRRTTRYTRNPYMVFPAEAHAVRARLAEALGFARHPAPEFKDGMVASYAEPGDTCYSHVDPTWSPGLYTVHCNVILSAPDAGGELVVEGEIYDMPQGKFICYPVSEVEHGTLLVKGEKPRVMWVFGFCVEPEHYKQTAQRFQ